MKKTLGFGVLGAIFWAWQAAFAAVDLNAASAEEIAEALNGIGKVKAEAIVAERAQNGPFKDLNEVAERVKGIGPATLEKNKDNIVLGTAPAQPDNKAQAEKK
ncbi:MAG: ComEA family DNA-binding protein [Methylohalobius sp.]